MENNNNNDDDDDQLRLQNIQRLNELLEQRRNSDDPTSIPINFESADLRQMNLDGANFQGASLSGANLSNSDLTNCNFIDAHLEEVDFIETNLTGSNLFRAFLDDANLSNAILREANLELADLQHSSLERANLELATLTEANLSFADLRYANFHEAWLHGTILANSEASNANFSYANLNFADFYEADINQAIFTEASIGWTVFDGANVDQAIDLVIDQDDDDTDEEIDEELYNVPDGDIMIPGQMGVQQQPRGLAYEIHEKFAKILAKQNEYLAIIDQPPAIISIDNLYRHIQTKFLSHIEFLFPGDNEKLNEFNTAFERINNRIPGNLKSLILDTIDFAFSRDDDFIREYILVFLDESCRAYTGPNPVNNLSCVNGIIERFITAVGGAVQVLCVSGCENETYQKLDKLFNPKFNIAETANEWWNTIAETDEIKILTKEQRKEDFKNYLRNKARELDNYNAEIEQKIVNYANEIDYSFENLALGGGKKLKKTRKTRNTRKSKKSKQVKKSRKHKSSPKSKNSKKSRKLRKKQKNQKSKKH